MKALCTQPEFTKLNEARKEKVLSLISGAKDANEKFVFTRLFGIGGTDVAAILGISPWKTPFQLWQEKTFRVQPSFEENPFTHWGKLLESVIRKEYWDIVGHNFGDEIRNNVTFACSSLPCLVGNLDSLIYKDDKKVRLHEIKTAMLNAMSGDFDLDDRPILSWGEGNIYQTDADGKLLGVIKEDGQIPKHYRLQVEAYMMCSGVDACDVSVLIGHHDFRIFTVHANKKLQEIIFKKVDDFWCHNVLEDNPPKLTSDDYDEKESIPGVVVAEDSVVALHSQLDLLRQKIAIDESKEKSLIKKLKEAIGENDVLVDSNGRKLCTYKTTAARMSFDKERFMQEQPEMFRKYQTPGKASRRFLFKSILNKPNGAYLNV